MRLHVILVRHPPVAACYQGICYGWNDLPLDAEGLAQVKTLVQQLLVRPVTYIFHSGLIRAALVAEALGHQIGLHPRVDHRLRERHFGAWEGQSWEHIYQQTGDAMNGMVTQPDQWRPPGGETTYEMRDRVVNWYQDLPASGTVVAVCHGGPIAALRGTIASLPVEHWIDLIPPAGTIVEWVRP